MKVLIILSVLVASAYAGLLGSSRCTWGPSYWCSKLRHAKECNAYDHCVSTVWTKQQLPKVKGSEVCDFCKNIIGDVRKFIDSNKTKADIVKYLDQACAVIPIQQFADECKSMVKNDLPQFLDMVAKQLDPQVICSSIFLCPGLEDKVPRPALQNKKDYPIKMKAVKVGAPTTTCKDCEKFVGDLQKMITQKSTEDQIIQMIEASVCQSLGVIEEECKKAVEQYVPMILQLVADEVDPAQVCKLLGFCAQFRSGVVEVHSISKRSVGGEAECLVCKEVLTELQKYDRDPAVQNEVKDCLRNNLCAKLGSIATECRNVVDLYAPMVFQVLANELDPDTVCKAISLCSANGVSAKTREAAVLKKEKVMESKVTAKASPQCVLCEFVMKQLDDILGQNATQAEIEAALDKVCSLLPSTIAGECKAFVDQYAPAIINLLLQELSPDQICTVIGLCGQQGSRSKTLLNDSELCGICETMIQYLDSLLEENATVTEIEQALEKVCNFLPEGYAKQCDAIVEQYGPAIAQMIAQLADPHQVCAAVGLCGYTGAAPMKTKQHKLTVPIECTKGPSYWCLSLQNAKKCNMVKYCKDHH